MRLPLRFLWSGVVLATAVFAADKSPLADAPSAFVRAQAASAVHWQPWTDAVLAQAKQQSKPVYVFVGSPLSELTRATLNQTFTSEKTIAWVNENFFCIFIDSDVQPEVAAYAQHFITSVKQLKGYPVHCWLTPDTLQPYDGANYLPPSEEWGKAGFLKSARSALDTWKLEPARAHAQAEEGISMMKLPPLEGSAKIDLAAKLEAATKAWVAAADAKNGGFGTAPKLPEPELIRFLLTRDQTAKDTAINAARALVKGALRDPVDGGFYRRCIDDEWKEPYFQKTLMDQARIAVALFDAAKAGPDDSLRTAAIGALDFALKDLRNSDGTFAAALDGTLEENPDPARRPKFARIGLATTGARGFLIFALRRSGEKRLVAAAEELAVRLRAEISASGVLPHLVPGGSPGTAFDHLASVRGFRELVDNATADRLLATTIARFFDPQTGLFQNSPVPLPTGIAARVPASGDVPAPEVIALRSGADVPTADLLRRALLAAIEYDELPPGDVLYALSQK